MILQTDVNFYVQYGMMVSRKFDDSIVISDRNNTHDEFLGWVARVETQKNNDCYKKGPECFTKNVIISDLENSIMTSDISPYFATISDGDVHVDNLSPSPGDKLTYGAGRNSGMLVLCEDHPKMPIIGEVTSFNPQTGKVMFVTKNPLVQPYNYSLDVPVSIKYINNNSSEERVGNYRSVNFDGSSDFVDFDSVLEEVKKELKYSEVCNWCNGTGYGLGWEGSQAIEVKNGCKRCEGRGYKI